jgi:flagellar L-ring protein precursor FlgH
MSLNQGDEFIRIQGIVRTADVLPDNSVPSYKIANAQISYGGVGALADANRMGWLSRFFNSPVWPF